MMPHLAISWRVQQDLPLEEADFLCTVLYIRAPLIILLVEHCHAMIEMTICQQRQCFLCMKGICSECWWPNLAAERNVSGHGFLYWVVCQDWECQALRKDASPMMIYCTRVDSMGRSNIHAICLIWTDDTAIQKMLCMVCLSTCD